MSSDNEDGRKQIRRRKNNETYIAPPKSFDVFGGSGIDGDS